MPKTKSTRGRQRKQQTSVRRSSRPSTRASTGATAGLTPRARDPSTQPQSSDSLAQGALTDLLDLIHEQVRAEIQAQQTGQEASAAGQPTVSMTADREATSGRTLATSSQSDPGMLAASVKELFLTYNVLLCYTVTCAGVV